MPIEKFSLNFTKGQIETIKEIINQEIEIENDKPNFCTQRLGRLLKIQEEIEVFQRYLGFKENRNK